MRNRAGGAIRILGCSCSTAALRRMQVKVMVNMAPVLAQARPLWPYPFQLSPVAAEVVLFQGSKGETSGCVDRSRLRASLKALTSTSLS